MPFTSNDYEASIRLEYEEETTEWEKKRTAWKKYHATFRKNISPREDQMGDPQSNIFATFRIQFLSETLVIFVFSF